MKWHALVCVAMAVSSVSAFAKTVTVNSGGGADFTSISLAIADARVASDGLDVIQITGGGPYIEPAGLTLRDESITVIGTGSTPVVVCGKTAGNPASTTNDRGVAIFNASGVTTPMTVSLENLTIIPQVGNEPLQGIRSNNNASGLGTGRMTIYMKNVTVSANNGNNQPVATSSFPPPTKPAGITGQWRDDASQFTGFVADIQTTGLRVVGNFGNPANSPDAFIFFPDDPATWTCYGPSDFSYSSRCGIQAATDGCRVRFIGSAANPINIIGNNQIDTGGVGLGVWFDGTNTSNAQGVTSEFSASYVVAGLQGTAASPSDNFSFLFADAGQPIPVGTVSKLASYSAYGSGYDFGTEMPTNSTFDHCTSYGNKFWPIHDATATGLAATITFTDSVIAGDGSNDVSTTGSNTVRGDSPVHQLVVINSGLPTAGPYRLAGTGTSSSTGLAPIVTNVTNADPDFASVNNPLSAAFVDVRNTAYASQGTGSQPASGYGDYTPAASGIKEWSLF